MGREIQLAEIREHTCIGIKKSLRERISTKRRCNDWRQRAWVSSIRLQIHINIYPFRGSFQNSEFNEVRSDF